jgi:hypothetical protein
MTMAKRKDKTKTKEKKPKLPKIDESARLVTPGINKVPEQKVEQQVEKIAEDLKKIESEGDLADMPEEKTVVLKAVTPAAGQGGAAPVEQAVSQSINPEDWMIVVSMKNRRNAILHIAGLMNLIVSLELIGESSEKDPEIAANELAKEIYAHNINEAQTLIMLHVTQLVVQHQITWDEVLNTMVSDYMGSMPEADRTKEKEEGVRAQAYGVISTGYDIIARCRNDAITKASGANGRVEPKSA